MSTPALRAIRKHFANAKITFLASKTVRDILGPCDFCDEFMPPQGNPIKMATAIRQKGFDKAILFKNSFGSAMTVFLAGVSVRIGYDRDWRGMFLTNGIKPKMKGIGKFKPAAMLDYYLNICKEIGCDVSDRAIELNVSQDQTESVTGEFGEIFENDKPLAILVPGGAFGPSKLWRPERYAAVADALIEKYNASVIVSVAPNEIERRIAGKICKNARNKLISLAEYNLSLGQLKGLFAKADIVITNDTGGRHIAIALKKKVVTLFGPNNPKWTQTGFEGEIQICGQAKCVPCDKPKCRMTKHICMDSITVEQVIDAVEKLL
jgi:heptosyltransferase-2